MVACELASPLTVRRTVAVSSAVVDGAIDVEGMRAERVSTAAEAERRAATGVIAVLVSPELPPLRTDVVIDARLAKRNIDTTIDDGPLVIGVGPGFTAAVDCHAVIETNRGHHLGRVLWEGSAAPNTGTPGVVGGKGSERVIRAGTAGLVRWGVSIGDQVAEGDVLGRIGAAEVILAPFAGVVRGLIAEDVTLTAGLKIGDVDPRADAAACHEISDKALAVGGGVVEAVLSWPR